MLERYQSDDFDSGDDALDELLCEYVDGTMDETVKEAFEEYLEANPDLAQHAECLCRTREKLYAYGCRHVRASLQIEIRRRVMQEMRRQDQSAALVSARLGNAAKVTSAVSLLVIFGMMVGITAVSQIQVEGDDMTVEFSSDEPMVSASDAHATLSGAVPLEWPVSTRHAQSLLAPVSSLPTLSATGQMTPILWSNSAADSLSGIRIARLSAP